MNFKRILLAFGACAAITVCAGVDAAKIAANSKCRVTGSDKWCGGARTIFEFRGCETWVVEPEKPAAGNPWAWIMEWPGAFKERTATPQLLAAGYRVVTFRPGFYQKGRFVSRPGNMNDERVKESREFQRFLVDELGYAPKANLIGMSWGGFYSVRYASFHPECVARIYLDAPLLDFSSLSSYRKGGAAGVVANYPAWKIDIKTYKGIDDPRQPINRAEPIAKAGIPVLLLYGGKDVVVPPEENCELFVKRFKEFGGKISATKRPAYGHHPHGFDAGHEHELVDFFNGK